MKTEIIKSEIQDIVQKLAIAQPVVFESVLENIDNDIYFLTDATGKKVVLREAKRTYQKDPDFEIRLISLLTQNNFHALRLVPFMDGALYQTNAKGWSIFAFEFIFGKQYETKDIVAKPELAFAGGVALGEMHRIASGEKDAIGANTKRDAFTEIDLLVSRDTSNISNIEGWSEFIDMLATYREQVSKYIKEHPDRCGAIHSDYGPQNVIFSDLGVYIIDLDWACAGPFIKDIGQGLALWSWQDKHLSADKETMKQFISGYNTTAPFPIPPDIDDDLLFWIRYSCLSDACTFFHSFLDGYYSEINLTRVNQCHGFQRFEYFK